MKKSLLFISLILLTAVSMNAQQVYKSGGLSGSTFLFSQPSYCAKSQCIFLPSDLTNVHSGNIVTLYYKYGNVTAGQTLYNYTIKMGQTTATAYTGGNTFFTGLTTVLSEAAYSIPQGTSGSWFPISLTTPFAYDSTQTLIIQFTFDSVLVNSWLTLGTNNNLGRKIISPDVNAITGSASSGTWQDMGFDLAPLSVSSVTESPIEFSFFPNPCKGKLNLVVPENNTISDASFILMNSIGGEVMRMKVQSGKTATFDLTQYARGIYFLKEISAEKARMHKIVLE